MKEDFVSVFNSILFKGLEKKRILEEVKSINYSIKKYSKNEIIALEGSPCSSIAIIIEGEVELQKLFASGNFFILKKLYPSDIFGEVVVFSERSTYPATIASTSNSKIMFLSKEGILKLCKIDEDFLNNFMKLMSSKILALNNKLEEMSLKSIREKLANYILKEYRNQYTLNIKLKDSKKNIALSLGVPRPSLSRELITMREEGILSFGRDFINILDLDKLCEILN